MTQQDGMTERDRQTPTPPRPMTERPQRKGEKVHILPSPKTQGVAPGTEGEVGYIDHHVTPEYQPVKPEPTYDVTIPESGSGDTRIPERTLQDLTWGRDVGW